MSESFAEIALGLAAIAAEFHSRGWVLGTSGNLSAEADALALASTEVLFISDVIAELDAAHAAGMQTLLCVRPGNQPQIPAGTHEIIYSLDSLAENQRSTARESHRSSF